jgi:hypothetical protein
MSRRRLRAGEWLALAGALVLLVSLFLDWFGLDANAFEGVLPRAIADAVAQDGWSSLGWLLDVLLAVAIALALWLAVATLTGPTAQAVLAGVLTAAGGTVVFVVLLVRVLTQPDLGVDAPNALVDVRTGAYVGLAGCLALAAGGWLAIGDERTDAPESAYEPPPARPAP